VQENKKLLKTGDLLKIKKSAYPVTFPITYIASIVGVGLPPVFSSVMANA
jgi:hypothetical protein